MSQQGPLCISILFLEYKAYQLRRLSLMATTMGLQVQAHLDSLFFGTRFGRSALFLCA